MPVLCRQDLPAGTTAAILPLLDCKRTVRQVYDELKGRQSFVKEMGWAQFKKEVRSKPRAVLAVFSAVLGSSPRRDQMLAEHLHVDQTLCMSCCNSNA